MFRLIGNWKETEIGRIPEDWGFDTLGSNLIIKGRIGWKGLKKSEYVEQGYAIINGEQIINDSIDWNSCGRITTERYDESPEIMLRESDILMTKDGTIGKLAYINEMKEPTTVASGIFVIRNNSTKLDQKYLYYVFKSNYFKNLVESRIEGSVVPHLYQRDIVELKIPFPPLQEQRKIADVFLSLDNKIALNRSMNSTLEAIGQALFKRWFVELEFPNKEGKPYRSSGGEMVETELGGVPRGWRVGTLGEICEITMGQSPPGKTYNEIGDGLPFYQGISDFGFRFPSRRVYCTAPTRFAEEDDVLLSVRAPVGSLNMAEERCAIGRGVAALRLKGKQKGYLYYLLRATQSGWNKFEAEGTVFGSVTKSDVHDFKVILPPDALRNQFGSLVESLDKQIATNENQSRTLAALRDALLPKLMSGEIRVNIESKDNNRYGKNEI